MRRSFSKNKLTIIYIYVSSTFILLYKSLSTCSIDGVKNLVCSIDSNPQPSVHCFHSTKRSFANC